MRLLLIGADRREFSGLASRLSGVKPMDCRVDWAMAGELKGVRLAMLANGPGPVLAAEAVEAGVASGRPDALVSFGFCGALDPALRPGEVFVAETVVSGGQIYRALRPRAGRPHAVGVLLSADRVVVNAAEKAALYDEGAAAVEMEAASVARAALAWGVPLYAIRAVTDTARESLAVDFNAIRRPDGRFGWRRLAFAAAQRPRTVLPELFRLARRARLASRNLGEFVAACEF